jgi:hypothetical protein
MATILAVICQKTKHPELIPIQFGENTLEYLFEMAIRALKRRVFVFADKHLAGLPGRVSFYDPAGNFLALESESLTSMRLIFIPGNVVIFAMLTNWRCHQFLSSS